MVMWWQVAKEAEVDFKKAQEKYEESRRIKADYYDAFVSLGNLDFERGKLALGLAIPPPTCAPLPPAFISCLQCLPNPSTPIRSPLLGT